MTSPDSPLVKSLQKALTHLGDEPEFFVDWAGITDSRLYRERDIDTVIMGPVGENEHGANESMEIEKLVKQAKIYAATISDLLGV